MGLYIVILVFMSMVLYGVVHSFLAGRFKLWFQDQFGEYVFHGLYRLFFNLMSIITLLPTLALMMSQGDKIVWEIDSSLHPLIVSVQIIGIVGLIVSLLQIDLGRFVGTKQLQAFLNDEQLPLPDESLQTRGLYRFVRHPLYLFSILAIWSVMSMSEAYLGFCLGATLYFVIGSYYEEKRLVRAFSNSYTDYQKQVPWLIPFVKYPYFPRNKT